MATKLAIEGARRGDVFSIPPDAITPNWEIQGRMEKHSDRDIEELAESFLRQGQQSPCRVRKRANGQLELVFGFRRWEAAKWIRENRDPNFLLRVEVVRCNDEEAFISNIEENRKRLATTPIDDAVNARVLADHYGKTVPEIAAILGCSQAWVRRLSDLLLLPADIRDKVHRGTITLDAAFALAKLGSSEEMREALAEGDAATTASVKERARSKGVRLSRGVGDLKRLCKKSQDNNICSAILDYLAGRIDEENFLVAIGCDVMETIDQ
jgi:ParB/RepB/Spo0J family partition protein